MIFDKLFKKDKDSSKTTESKPVSEMDYYAEGKAQFDAGHYTQAMEYFQAAIAEHSERENAYLKLAETYIAMDRKKDAEAIRYKLLSLQPDDTDVQQMRVHHQNPQTIEQPKPRSFNTTRNIRGARGGNQRLNVKGVSFKMVYVEGGTFTMGATPEQGNYASDEKPIHSVTLSSYYIGQTEVTQALWEAVMGSNPSYFSYPYFKGDNLPVERVNWNDCQEFIRRLNQLTGKTFRLPTEAEWEYAARGGKKSRSYKYSGSNSIDAVAWYSYNSSRKTHAVGDKSPNELGLYGMSGNVWEWCQGWYENYSNYAQTNPTGSYSGDNRVCRGGGWGSNARDCRISSRNYFTPVSRRTYLGLRLVLLQPDNIATQQAVSKNTGGGKASKTNHIQQKNHKQRFSSILNPMVFRYVLYSVTTLNVIQICAAISRITSWGVWDFDIPLFDAIAIMIGLLGTIIVIGVPAFLTIGGVMMIEQDVTVNLKKTNILFIVLNFALIATLYYLPNPRLWSWHHLWLLLRPLVFLICILVAIVVIYYMGRGLYYVFIYMAKKIVEFFTT